MMFSGSFIEQLTLNIAQLTVSCVVDMDYAPAKSAR